MSKEQNDKNIFPPPSKKQCVTVKNKKRLPKRRKKNQKSNFIRDGNFYSKRPFRKAHLPFY